MADMSRAELTHQVYTRLRDRAFRNRLRAVLPSGEKPVLVAMRTDPVQGLLHKVVVAGGAANVVVPALNGFIVLAMDAAAAKSHKWAKENPRGS